VAVIDLHAHVLPGIDDGPSTLEEALGVAAEAAAEGVRTLAATPHLRADHPAVRPEELAARTASLQDSLAERGTGLELIVAAEVDLSWARRANRQQLSQASFGQRGRDLLVETPYGELPAAFEDILFHLTAQGFRLLLAHPERNPTLQRDPSRLHALVGRGMLLQVTASALTGSPRGSATCRTAQALVQEGVAHVIASDRHGSHVERTGLRRVVDVASALAGARAEWMVTEAPAAILAGEPLPPAPSGSPPRRGWFRGR
jgi:protein-tyrosine phosphatase